MENKDPVEIVLGYLSLDVLKAVARKTDAVIESPRNKRDYVEGIGYGIGGLGELFGVVGSGCKEVREIVCGAVDVYVREELKFSQKKRQIDAAEEILYRLGGGASRSSLSESYRLTRECENLRNRLDQLSSQVSSQVDDAMRSQLDKDRVALGEALDPLTYYHPGFDSLCRSVTEMRNRLKTVENDKRALEDYKRKQGELLSAARQNSEKLREELEVVSKTRDAAVAQSEADADIVSMMRSELSGVAQQRDDALWQTKILKEEVERLAGCLLARDEERRLLELAHEKVVESLQDEVEFLKEEVVNIRGEMVRVESEISAKFKTDLEQRTSAQSAADKRASKAEMDLAEERNRSDDLRRKLHSALASDKSHDSGASEVYSLKRTIVAILENWKFTLGVPAGVAARIVGVSSGGDHLPPDQAWEELIVNRGVLRAADVFKRVAGFCESRMDLLDSETWSFVEKYRLRMGWTTDSLGKQLVRELKLPSPIKWSEIRPSELKPSRFPPKLERQRPDRLELAAIRAWVASAVG